MHVSLSDRTTEMKSECNVQPNSYSHTEKTNVIEHVLCS